MIAHVQQANILNGRSMALVTVIGLHALVIIALITAKMVPRILDTGPPPIKVIDVPPEQHIDVPPKLTAKNMLPQLTAIIVPPEIVLPQEVETRSIQAQVSDKPAEAVVGPTESTPVGAGADVPASHARPSTALQYRITRSTDEYYPDASVALQEEGVAIVRVCVDAAGRMQGAPAIESTSGIKRLDQAALRWARESLQFKPATENGVAVPACKGFRVNFNLH